MKKTVTLNVFRDAFTRMNRRENFSYEGLEALFNYLEYLEEETGSEFELDVIGLCCDFTEYENLEEFHHDYDAEEYPTRDEIADETTLIYIDGTAFIIQQF